MTVVVVGAGRAGLAVSHELGAAGVDHVVLERGHVAEAWRRRWDSFTLVTPNWTLALPGSSYDGDEPEGHVHRDQIVEFLRPSCGPVRRAHPRGGVGGGRRDRSGRDVPAPDQRRRPGRRHRRRLHGASQRPHLPVVASAFPGHVAVMDVTSYRNPTTYRRGGYSWSARGRPVCSWPRSCIWPVATSCLRVAARRGLSASARWPGHSHLARPGRLFRPAALTLASPRPGWSRMCRRRVRGAATTCTTESSSRWV